MTIVKDLTQLGRLVAAQHGWPVAKAFKSYVLDERDTDAISQSAIDVLKVFPADVKGASLITAALAVRLESRLPQAPVQVVAGTLSVEGVPVIGTGPDFDGAAVFAQETPEFSGHMWVMLGGHIVDVALFRAAYSAQGPAALARHIDLVFGPGKGLYVDPWRRTAKRGLTYTPQYVLSSEDVTRLMAGAYRAIKGA